MARKRKGDPVHGWVIFNKPVGMTSTQAVGFVRRVFNAQKAGHGGTLDPLASGVLPIALGEATKTMNYVLNADKHYRFTVTFGTQTNTDDSEGDTTHSSEKRPSRDQMEDALPNFMGEISQTPPAFSAVKIKGKAAYARAREGEDVTLRPRTITVHSLKLVDFDGNTATFNLHASKGTYVRAIARDLGALLGCYGHVSALTRTQAGKFALENAVDEQTLASCLKKGQDAHEFLLDVAAVLDDIPAYKASPSEERALATGRQLVRVHLKPGLLRVVAPEGRLLSLVEVGQAGEFKIVRNFNM